MDLVVHLFSPNQLYQLDNNKQVQEFVWENVFAVLIMADCNSL